MRFLITMKLLDRLYSHFHCTPRRSKRAARDGDIGPMTGHGCGQSQYTNIIYFIIIIVIYAKNIIIIFV